MDTNLLTNQTLQAAFVGVGLALTQLPAYGQQSTDVTVETSQIRREVQPIGPLGARVAVVTASDRASFADLDLATYSGAMALESRIRDAAKHVCRQLVVADPGSFDGDPPCVRGALQGAMLQARAAIRAAEARAHARLESRAAAVVATNGSEHR